VKCALWRASINRLIILVFLNRPNRDVPDFGSGSGKSGIRPYFGNPAKSGSGQNFDRIWPDLGQLFCMEKYYWQQLIVLELLLESSTSVSSSEQPMDKQTGSSLWNSFDTLLHDMSADGNCISAELDQFLSDPLISRQDDPASWWKMNMHTAHVSSVVTTRTEISGTTTYQRPIREALLLYRTCRDIDLLEVQQLPLGRVTFQLVA